MNITVLRQKKADALAKARAIHKTAADANRLTTTEEDTAFDAAMAEAASYDPHIKRAELLMDAERTAPAIEGSVVVGADNAAKKPWASFGEQLMAVAAGQKLIEKGRANQADPRLFASLGANESVPAEGGFLVEPEYANGILQKSYEVGQVAKLCNKMPMSSSRLILNAVDEDSRVDGSRWGGIQSFWNAEGSNYTGTKPKFREIQLTANKLIGLCYATEEQLMDGPALEAYIGTAFPEEFAFKIDDAIVNGTGAGQPLGFQTSTATIVQAKDSGQATGTVSATNILNMWTRMWAPSRRTAVWLIEQSVEAALYPLLLAGTNATTAALMFTPAGLNGNNSPFGLLMGRPVIPIEQAANFSSQGDISLVDMTQYLLAQRSDVRADSSIHVAFLTGEQAFRFMLRLDGQPWWKKPLTPKASGAATRSPFVTLAAR